MEDLTNDEIVLAGLGEVGGRGNRLRKAVRGEMGASRFRKQFLERVHKMPRNIQKALMNGRAQISDAPYYATAEIKGNRCEMIKPSHICSLEFRLLRNKEHQPKFKGTDVK